jgi:hypothetical protein
MEQSVCLHIRPDFKKDCAEAGFLSGGHAGWMPQGGFNENQKP